MGDNVEEEIVFGMVKWFDPAKGFGFVVTDEDGPDILLHSNVLRSFGQSSVADESRIEMVVNVTSRGKQAVKIISIEPPEYIESSSMDDFEKYPEEDIAALPLVAARVKWFDRVKGFGFANVFGCVNDVFIHMDVLIRSGLGDVQPGEAIAVRVIKGKRGRIAVAVTAWETAVKN